MEKVIFSLEKYKESMEVTDDCPQWAYDVDGLECHHVFDFFDDYSIYACQFDEETYFVSTHWVEVITID